MGFLFLLSIFTSYKYSCMKTFENMCILGCVETWYNNIFKLIYKV